MNFSYEELVAMLSFSFIAGLCIGAAIMGIRDSLEHKHSTSLECEAARVIAALEAERESFHMDYRMKCDEETKRLTAERDAALADAERERMRLAACSVAALGYFDGCADEYRSASLDDVVRLKSERDAALAALGEITWSNDSKWQTDRAKAALAEVKS